MNQSEGGILGATVMEKLSRQFCQLKFTCLFSVCVQSQPLVSTFIL